MSAPKHSIKHYYPSEINTVEKNTLAAAISELVPWITDALVRAGQVDAYPVARVDFTFIHV